MFAFLSGQLAFLPAAPQRMFDIAVHNIRTAETVAAACAPLRETIFIENIEVTSEEREKHIKQYKDFIKNDLSNICHINHFCWKSVEEQVNHCIKFEANKHDEWCLHEHYIELLKQYPELFSNPRDLYKIYYLNNENN